jgi:hypothetical protein
MKGRPHHPLLLRALAAAADDCGAALIEAALALPLFLFLLLGLIDFGRLGYSIVMARSAVDIAARIAAVRPPVLCGTAVVPKSNTRGTATDALPFGTSCSAEADVCATPQAVTCPGSADSPTAAEIWTVVQPLMPSGTTIANLQFSYRYDSNLNFLGGPYVPTVTVSLANAEFQFVTPLGAFAQAFAGGPLSFDASKPLPFPTISAALPGEDLAEGNDG